MPITNRNGSCHHPAETVTSSPHVTRLLVAWGQGDDTALDQLIPIVHAELHRIAKACMTGERPGHSLQATALVNEAYLRLVEARSVNWQNRAHFLAVAARLMRRILCDFARSKQYQKRGGGGVQVTLVDDMAISHEPGRDLVALDDALAGTGKARRAKEQSHRDAVFRRPERAGNRRGTRRVTRDGHARLENGEGMAAPRAAQSGRGLKRPSAPTSFFLQAVLQHPVRNPLAHRPPIVNGRPEVHARENPGLPALFRERLEVVVVPARAGHAA